MRALAAATIVAKPALALARVLARSFHAFHPTVPFFVLLADEPEGYFDPQHEPFTTISLAELALPAAEAMCFRYEQQPLSYALTPFLLSHLLERGFDTVAFFKQESLVLASLDPVLDTLGQAAITLTPHMLAPFTGGDGAAREQNIVQSGLYNVGFLGVARHPEARRFLAWWQERTREHAHHAVAEGMHYEQRWLDLVPGYFASTQFVRDPGFNVGHWNLPDRRLGINGEQVLVENVPCRFMRFSGFDPARPDMPTRYNSRLSPETLGPAAALFQRYHRLLTAAGYDETSRWPYAFSRFANGVAIPAVVRQIFASHSTAATGVRALFAPGPHSLFAWLQEPADLPGDDAPAVSRLWHAIYQLRPDLQAAFPDLAGRDRAAFLAWAATTGAREHAIPVELLPGVEAGAL